MELGDLLQIRIFLKTSFYLQNLYECGLLLRLCLFTPVKMSPNLQVKLVSFPLWVYFPQHSGMNPQTATQLF